MNKAKLYKLINTGLSILLALLACYFLYFLFQNRVNELSEIDIKSLVVLNPWSFVMIFVLVFFNWGIEAHKWRYLILKLQFLSWKNTFWSIMAGILLGVFTPNRIGELGGRLLYIEKDKLGNALYFNAISAASQLIVSIVFGLLSFLFFKQYLQALVLIPDPFYFFVYLSLPCLFILLYFRSNILFKGINWFKRKTLKQEESMEVNFPQRLNLLLYSLLRYFVFCLQFFLLLRLFEYDISFIDSSFALSLLFFVTTLIPSGWISDLPIRGSVAFLIFEMLGESGFSGLYASVLLWCFNLLVPLLISLFVLRKVNWMKGQKITGIWKF